MNDEPEIIRFLRRLALTLLLPLSLAFGCSSGNAELGTVEGSVLMDGVPLSGAYIIFEPRDGSPSMGYADEAGRYELKFSRSLKGASIGDHLVRISTAEDAQGRRSKELVPARYNVKSELTAKVDPGANTIEFDLKSDGPVVQSRD